MPTTVRLGKTAKLFRNTGTYLSPTWTEMPNVMDLRLPLDKAEVNATTRGSGDWEAFIGGLKTLGLEFDIIYNPTAADVLACRDSFFNNTVIDLLVLDGPLTTGNTGVRFNGECFRWLKDESRRIAQKNDCMFKNAYSDNAPVLHTVA